ncbi:hypothetical protein Pcinc_036080 [Petrolisthes cinctipes]|uniref:Uncharacterized protein n=1 Tax=Petrolisthes cinctipes TaxID=88211 RepID=A0AAE1ENZ9_PETCI|nr:hypothetical protein Pcinc_036080 [Petrolisthes cinctipes]
MTNQWNSFLSFLFSASTTRLCHLYKISAPPPPSPPNSAIFTHPSIHVTSSNSSACHSHPTVLLSPNSCQLHPSLTPSTNSITSTHSCHSHPSLSVTLTHPFTHPFHCHPFLPTSPISNTIN